MGKAKRNKNRRKSGYNHEEALRRADATRQRARGGARARVDIDTGTASPEDQAAAFFNRPGDYFLAKFSVGGAVERLPGAGVTFVGETVLKASEDQFDYLLEVLRQIRGGFDDKCRIELYRTHTVER